MLAEDGFRGTRAGDPDFGLAKVGLAPSSPRRDKRLIPPTGICQVELLFSRLSRIARLTSIPQRL
jgi:hypothetical protein